MHLSGWNSDASIGSNCWCGLPGCCYFEEAKQCKPMGPTIVNGFDAPLVNGGHGRDWNVDVASIWPPVQTCGTFQNLNVKWVRTDNVVNALLCHLMCTTEACAY